MALQQPVITGKNGGLMARPTVPKFSFWRALLFGPTKWTIVARSQSFGVTAAIYRRPALTKTHGKFVYRVSVWKSFKPRFGKWRTSHELYYDELRRGLAALADCQRQIPPEA